MKLEDIKKAVCNAAESEFKRAFYNAAAVMAAADIVMLFDSLHKEVYESSDARQD